MRADQEKYILENAHNKTPARIARDIGVSERKIKRLLQMRGISSAVKKRGTDIGEFLTSRFSGKKLFLAACLITAVITALVFAPSLGNKFVEWDDPEYVYENPFINQLSVANIKGMFTHSFQGAYCPLTIFSLATDHIIGKTDPFAYHLTNYFLHIATTLLVLLFIYLLCGDIVIAFIVSLLFGIHPLHVESVAWISERKDVLYALFYMLALVIYQKYIVKKTGLLYTLCLAMSLFSLLAKPMAVTIPVLLLLLDYYYGKKVGAALVIEKIPFFAIAGIVGVISYKFQVLSGVTNVGADTLVRVYFLLKQIPFYLSKLVFPHPLSAIYMFYNIDPSHLPELYFNAFVVIGLAGAAFISLRYTKDIFFGIAFFGLSLLPVLKLIPTGDVFAADRYMYLPSIGIFYLLALAIRRFIMSGTSRPATRIICAMVLIVWTSGLGCLTIARCAVWKDSETLFLDILRQNPNIPTANNNLGGYYIGVGQYDKAIPLLERALASGPAPELQQMININLTRAYNLKKQSGQ